VRVTLSLLGWELDLTLGPADAPSPAPDDEASSMDGGTTASYPISFTATYEMPEEFGIPQRVLTAPVEDE
jgi:hypothetical protein